MAASYSLTFSCKACNRGTITITNAYEATGGLASGVKNNRAARCTVCGNPITAHLTSLAVAHSGNVGSNTTITHTITHGSISSAVS